MKKPKKTTAAKPLSTRGRTKTSAKTSKTKPAKTPRKKIAAKKIRAVTDVVKRVPARKPKPAPKVKRKVKAKAETISPPVQAVLEVKPAADLPVAKKTSATAKAAPKSPLLDVKPSSKAKAAGKVVSFADLKSEAMAKAVTKVPPKPPAKSQVEEPSTEPPADSKPEMGVELLFERKKASAKPRAKVKRVIKAKPVAQPKSVTEIPSAMEEKPKVKIETPVTKPISAAAPAQAKSTSRPARKAPAKIPAILLEGDKPEPTPVSGPGHRYALGPTAPVEELKTEGELPESYGTGTMLLTARDPHWLYTHWDLSSDQQRRYNAFSRDGHLIVRIYVEAAHGKPVAQVHVHPESRHWFVHVDRANTRYIAELGYYSAADKWTVVCTSGATLTPPDAVSADTTADFATVSFEVPMEKLLSLVKEAVQENAPLAQALQELRENGHTELPKIEVPAARESKPTRSETSHRAEQSIRAESPARVRSEKTPRPRWKPSQWTPAQERALAEVVSMDQVRRVWMGSLEITELIRRQFVNELASMSAAELGELAPGAPTSPAGAIGGISSPAAKPGAGEKGFWFNVNAELIVYGATEKDATVTIGGRKIKLRTDGSFSYRFALPDGNYEMPVVAISADQTDGRAAELKFSRSTEYRGDVGAHPQDPSLQQLILENF